MLFRCHAVTFVRVNFRFNIQKATEACLQFIKRSGGRINVMKLIKLIYILDRLSIQRRGVPVVGGVYFSMRNGPVTSELLDLVNAGELAGETGATIMLSSYPQATQFPADEDAVGRLAALQAIVLGIRQIRGELDIPHSRATPAWVVSERPNDADALASLAPLIARLGNLESVQLVGSEADLPPSAMAIVDGRTVLAPFSRLVDDLSAGAARLDRRHSRALADRDRSRARLANPGFVANAPAEVVAVERERLAELERNTAQLEEQLRRLNALIAGTGA